MENHLNVLSESLDDKIKVLQEIQEYNNRQEQAFRTEQVNMEEFDAAVEEKGRLIEKLTRLDDGFEILYGHLSEELRQNREKYAQQIKELQEKISKVTALSVSVQAQEARNKKLVEEYFRKARAGLGQNRRSSKAAYDYYKSMSGAGYPQNLQWDRKQ